MSLIKNEAKALLKSLSGLLPDQIRWTLQLRAMAILKIPMLAFVNPSVLELNERRCVVKIPLLKRNTNHFGTMYFAALAAGADLAGALAAWNLIDESDYPINLVFKDFSAEFLRRPDGDVHFICDQVAAIREAVERAAHSPDRQNLAVAIHATVPAKTGDEPVARFKLTLSLKKRND